MSFLSMSIILVDTNGTFSLSSSLRFTVLSMCGIAGIVKTRGGQPDPERLRYDDLNASASRTRRYRVILCRPCGPGSRTA